MPWKATCPMDEKLRFIVACSDGNEPLAELCRRFGISRKTGYKWLERYKEAGPEGLVERAPRATVAPHRVPDVLVAEILAQRKERPKWGPRKLRARLMELAPDKPWPAASTIGDVLKRHGLIHPRKRRVRAPLVVGSPLQPGKVANDLWCTDFKGHFGLGDGTRCHPLTISDDCSRFVLWCEGLVRTHCEPVKREFERVFREFGLPWRMRSDNGPPFASVGPGGLTALSVWWILLGILPERIEPGEPQQNGRHERMHRSLKLEVEVRSSLPEQQVVLDRFRRDFNEVRPHEALGQTPPARHYSPSPRPFPSELVMPEYVDCNVRWAGTAGHDSFFGKPISAGKCLAGKPVGLRQVGESTWEAFFGPVSLGTVDERDKEPRLKPTPRNARREGTANGDAFSCGQPASGLPTGKPPPPETIHDEFWLEEEEP